MSKKTIVICCSSAFYKHANEIASKLEKLGYNVVVPATALIMRKNGKYDRSATQTWIDNPADINIKVGKMDAPFAEIKKGDAILVLNDDKPNLPKYIGPNTLMEWGVAAYLGKPVFIFYGVDKTANTYEEVLTATAVLDGDLSKIEL